MRRTIAGLATLALTAAALHAQAAPNTLTPAEQKAGWKLLFDGSTTNGWHNYKTKGATTGWSVVDGALTRTAAGGDIVTDSMYRNFELTLEWKISPGGNSGVMYRAADDAQEIYWSAPEMQVLDNTKHPDGKNPLTSAGSDYALYPAPQNAVKPVGEWNQVRLVVNGNHVEHWLNGKKVVDYTLGSPDWKARVAKSKFKDWPEYGKATTGRIGLQDHGDWVAFRNIKIRELPGS
jgi:hypothetical protein